MATYAIKPERRTLHGKFSRELPPILTICSGDTVHVQTAVAGPAASTRAWGWARRFQSACTCGICMLTR